MFAIKEGLKKAWQKAMHLKKHWGFALSIYKILPPTWHRVWDEKKTKQCLMKCFKEIGIHV